MPNIANDRSKPEDTAKLAMYRLIDGGVRFIIKAHPSNKDLAWVDISAEDVQRMIDEDLPRLLQPQLPEHD